MSKLMAAKGRASSSRASTLSKDDSRQEFAQVCKATKELTRIVEHQVRMDVVNKETVIGCSME